MAQSAKLKRDTLLDFCPIIDKTYKGIYDSWHIFHENLSQTFSI